MASKKTGRPNGRPSKFDTIDMDILKMLVEKGFTDVEISKVFSITKQTLNNYKKENPKFFDSLKDWKLKADAKVERSLYERAKGYSCKEDKIFNDNGRPMIVPTMKHYPPDPTSIIYWLKNRQPDKWRDKAEGDNDLSQDEIKKLKLIASQETEKNM